MGGRDLLVAGPERSTPRLLTVLPVLAVAVAGAGLLAAGELRQASREDELARVHLELVGSEGATATVTAGGRSEAVVRLAIGNAGPEPVRLVDQRLDGGPPVDAAPAGALAAGATVLLAVRWRALCSEIGSLYGPASLGLTVRTRSGATGRVELPLGPPVATAGPRRQLRLAASAACARGVR